jgi:Carboxypeptidase regulatory-like domain
MAKRRRVNRRLRGYRCKEGIAMRNLSGCVLVLIVSLATASAAMASSVVGMVVDQNRHYVNNVYVTVTDAAGQHVGTGRTDLYGRYCIPLVKPGRYTLSLDPGNTGFNGGSAVANVDIEGMTVNWFVSHVNPAVASTNLGVESAATVTCGAGYWDAAAAGGLGVLGIGGIVGGVIGGETGGGPSSPSK